MDDWRMALATVFGVLGAIALAGIANEVYLRLTAAKINVRGKHCYVTGGSQGLGKCVAQDLARRGAHVTIVARRESVLKEAIEEIKAVAVDPKEQKIEYVVADVTNREETMRAIGEAVERQGKAIEYLFCVAGLSIPGMFVEQSPSTIARVMDINYVGTLNTVHEVTKRMVEGKVRGGHLVLVSSTLGFFGLIGYSGYCASKFAIRGLAEALRVELQMYGIHVHCYFPGTIYTPGYEAENLTKPQITLEIEGADEGMTPEKCSAGLFKGLARGEFAIATDPISMLFRCSTRGVMPNNNFVLDTFIAGIGWIALMPWRMFVDYTVKAHSKRKAKTE
ncbi:3-dehydrosphinganine reductase [Coemansia thaxteri]|uniref:3-dehydrosphinganine reductase n=1 Tax=Coemansia thaxteri TaxID=2663907 RepID=A0A9W8EM33_9FUNG|nr:3-dehydrosphinganine reductase [Coemansia thaxteri]KAJ2007976.1 3-dehydrosphinganine reductase [Coemansia thaxteri]KAJ2468631.1 3-dehydrosphinganine reductase [Coemansia sp. RSA 2322]KAJ2484010.1 3-dehydrosphinganine reductase [Coemansia sp. RSA 2320]